MRRIRRSPRRRARRGISLIEIVIAFMLLSLVLVEMRRIGIESMTAFDHSRNNLSGVWMANMIMNELISSELPNFDLELEGEGEAGLVEGRGGVGDFISEHFPEMWASMSEQRQEMLNEWGYHYSKMVFMISEDEQGGPDGAFAPYLDAEDFDEPTDDELEDPDYINPDDRLQKPTARVIRVMLVVTPPRGEGEDAEIPSLVDVPIFGGEGSIPDLDREVINPSELDEDERAERTAARRANYVMIRFIDVDNLRGVLAQPEEEASGGGR